LPGLKPFQIQGSHRCSLQSLHWEPKARQHPPDLAVSALSEDQSKPGSISISAENLKSLGTGTSSGMSAIGQEDATFQASQIRFLDASSDTDLVGSCDLVGWVCESLCKLTVIREQEQSGAVSVESSHWEQTGS